MNEYSDALTGALRSGDPLTPTVNADDIINRRPFAFSLSDALRRKKERVQQIAADVPHEVAANFMDLGGSFADTPMGRAVSLALGPKSAGPSRTAQDAAYQRIVSGEAPPSAAISETPYATHTGDLAANLIGDPVNLLTAGSGVLAKAGTRAAKGATRAVETAAERLAPRFDPGSPQQLIPGIEPLSLGEAHARALRDYQAAHQGMTFEDLNRGLRFEYDPDWRGAGEHYTMDYRDPESESYSGKRSVGRISQRPVPIVALEEPTSRTIPRGEFAGEGTVQAEVGAENFQQMLERLARLRAAESEASARGGEAASTQARALTERIQRNRALLAEPGITPQEALRLQEDTLSAMRQRPILDTEGGGGIVTPRPGEGLQSPIEWYDLLGRSASPSEAESRAIAQQAAIVRHLRGEPDPPPERRVRLPVEQHAALPEVEGRDPNAMSREAVNAFLTEARANPELFQYGLMPPENVESLEDFARHFGKKANMDIGVDWSYGDSDEPSKIKTEKTHGRYEPMRDRYGEYKYATHEPGDVPMYDERGNVKKIEKEKELVGPPPEGETDLLGTKEVKREAEGGELVYNDAGDIEFKKSRGGEPVRDERGRIKKVWEDNPDYSGSGTDVATIGSPYGEITVDYGDPASITATSAGKKGGQLLYQVALAHAARAGIDIGGGGLTDINQYRLLGNTLSNIARSGKNPRDVAGTLSGLAERARGHAHGPEVWRADAEEARSRLLAGGTDPDRVRFDPETGYSIDGKPATPDDIKVKIDDLSPRAGKRGRMGGVGQKSLMRNAVFEWLRNASPEEAQKVAAKWPKEWGPIFAGVTGLGALGGALQGGEQEQAD